MSEEQKAKRVKRNYTVTTCTKRGLFSFGAHSTQHAALFYIFIVSFFIVFIGCQKVVDINLNSTSPVIVIEGNISSEKGPYYIKLSKTVNFDQDNNFSPVTGAKVTINDNFGNIKKLDEIKSGLYSTSTFQSFPGRTYTLTVVSGGITYTANCSMPLPVNIESINVVKSSGFRGNQSYRDVKVTFQDPKGLGNCYRFVEIDNDTTFQDIHIINDQLHDGELMSYTIRNDQDSVNTGDSITVLLESISQNIYEYFRELNQITRGGGLSASPANPTSNLNNGAMGYFNAYAVTTKKTVIP